MGCHCCKLFYFRQTRPENDRNSSSEKCNETTKYSEFDGMMENCETQPLNEVVAGDEIKRVVDNSDTKPELTNGTCKSIAQKRNIICECDVNNDIDETKYVACVDCNSKKQIRMESNTVCEVPSNHIDGITADRMRAATQNDSQDHINNLLMAKCPPEVISKILSYMSIYELVHVVSLVSKSWHQAAYDASLWRDIDLRKYHVSDDVVAKVTSFSEYTRSIFIPYSKNGALTDAGIMTVAKNCPHLRTFVSPRSGSKLTDTGFTFLVENCPKLEKLRIDCLDITDLTLHAIAVNLENVRYLGLCQVERITNVGVGEVIMKCRKLETLILNQNFQITEECLEVVPKSACTLKWLGLLMCNIHVCGTPSIGMLTQLERLNLSQCRELDEFHILPIVQGCRNLKSISLNLNSLINDKCVDLIISSMASLTQIYLVSTKITDEALITMGKKGKNLAEVDVGYTEVTEMGVREISELCPSLKYLGLMRCDLVREEVVDELVDLYPRVTYSTFMQDTKRLLRKANIPIPII